MMESSALLAFDTSTPTARVALISADGECLVLRAKTAARHSANLLGLVDEVLRESGLAVAGLGAIACVAGPGSFTGLRVGLAVAKGLALPSARPLILVSSLDALACDLEAAAPEARWLLPCLDAGKGQIYARLYDAGASGERMQPRTPTGHCRRRIFAGSFTRTRLADRSPPEALAWIATST